MSEPETLTAITSVKHEVKRIEDTKDDDTKHTKSSSEEHDNVKLQIEIPHDEDVTLAQTIRLPTPIFTPAEKNKAVTSIDEKHLLKTGELKTELKYDDVRHYIELFVNGQFVTSFDAPFLPKVDDNKVMDLTTLKKQINELDRVKLLLPERNAYVKKINDELIEYLTNDFKIILPVHDFFKCLVLSEVLCRPHLPTYTYTNYTKEEVENYKENPFLFN